MEVQLYFPWENLFFFFTKMVTWPPSVLTHFRQSMKIVVLGTKLIIFVFSRGLRPGTKKCSDINDCQYLSLGDLEQNEFFSKSNLRFSCALTFNYGHVTYHVTRKWKWRKLANWWPINFVSMNKLAFLKEDKHTYFSTFERNVREV